MISASTPQRLESLPLGEPSDGVGDDGWMMGEYFARNKEGERLTSTPNDQRPSHFTFTKPLTIYLATRFARRRSYSRWEMSQEAEKRTWNSFSDGASTFDRTDEHLTDFDDYKPVGEIGANLGNFMEVGSGPWTQSYWMMRSRQFKVDRYVVLDPGVISYVGNVRSTVFRRGEIPGYEGKTVVINGGGEHLDIFRESFDTVMMVNGEEGGNLVTDHLT